MSGAITLGEVADRLAWLEVACRRCPRRGRLATARLVAAHGRPMAMPALRRVVAGDCPAWQAVSVVDLCGVLFPQLPAVFGRDP